MNGARRYASLFKTGQHGRLYLVSSKHARGRTFRIFVLPEGEIAQPNHDSAPLNENAVEVYGIISGNPGWTESYGWIHEGPWEKDFAKLVNKRESELAQEADERNKIKIKKEQEEKERIQKLLETYQ